MMARARLDAYRHSVREIDPPTETHHCCTGCGVSWKVGTADECPSCHFSIDDLKADFVYKLIEVEESES